jgi:hypothetical protein
LLQDRGCRVRERQLVLCRDDNLRRELVWEWLPEFERDDPEVVPTCKLGQTSA